MPADILFSHSLRMYSMLSFLGVWAWFFSRETLLNRNSKHSAVLMTCFQAALIYTHATGFFIAGCVGVFGIAKIRQEADARDRIKIG